MHMNSKQTLEADLRILFQPIRNFIIQNKFILSTTMILGIIAHMFAFTNKLVNGDELACLFSKGATLISGRWGLSLLTAIFPNISMPWIYGLISLSLLAIAVCFIAKLFNIYNKLLQILLAGLIVTFPALTGTFCYMFTSSSYMVAFLLIVLSVALYQKFSMKYYLMGIVCLVFSLSIYQAYISLASSLMLLVLIEKLLAGNTTIKQLIRHGLYMLSGLFISTVLYFGFTYLFQHVFQIEYGAYASSAMVPDQASMIDQFVQVYQLWIQYFTRGLHALIPSKSSRLIHIFCMLVFGLEILRSVIHFHSISKTFCLLLLLILFPISINCMYLVGSSSSIHTLVMYGFVSMYILLLVIINSKLSIPTTVGSRLGSKILIIFMSAIILINCYVSNETYLKLKLRYENTYSVCTTILAQVHMTPGYTENTPVVFLGRFETPDFYHDEMGNIDSLMGSNGVHPSIYSIENLFQYYLGQPINFADNEMKKQLVDSHVCDFMPSYPDYGSIQMVNNMIVVNFGDILQ